MATTSRPRPRKRDGTNQTSDPTNSNNTSVSPAPSGSANSADSSIVDEDDPNFPIPLFYDTSFSAHRVSPLYLGKEGDLSNKRLGVLAQRLRDVLVGDVVRGVEIGLGGSGPGEDSAMGRYGALERVGIRWFGLGRLLDVEPLRDEDDEEQGRERGASWENMVRRLDALRDKKRSRVLQICLEYENHMFEALLLPALSTEEEAESTKDGMQFYVGEAGKETQQQTRQQKRQFLNMPLLLLRMPPPLKIVIAEFLATSFDCRVSSLRLGTRSMVGALESWFRTVGVQSKGSLAKDITLWLGFHFPVDKDGVERDQGDDDEADGGPGQGQLGLKSIDVSIPVSDLRRFLEAGKVLLDRGSGKRKSGPFGEWGWETDLRKRRKLAGRLYEEGWEWRHEMDKATEQQADKEEYPFTEALGRYLDRHLGLDIFHPGVRITKVACGGFVMSEGKLKVFKPATLGEEDAQGVSASSPGQRGGVLELVGGLVEKAGVSPERFL
ncbi:Kinetochore complex Sim4 subunit Fta1 domain containing protein [Naviculisporaceae sp. PSN 640]